MAKRPETFWERLGQTLYWIAWPGIWLVIQVSPPRTRIVLTCQDKVLLVKDWLGNGEWTLPGGGLKRGEPAPVGALRELREETSIVLPPGSLKDLGRFKTKTNGIPVRILGFSSHPTTPPRVALQWAEIADYMWADQATLQQLRLNATALPVLAAIGWQTGNTR
jgi:ADP-ribose pyrophosphatase YjhB (NUDIX family)